MRDPVIPSGKRTLLPFLLFEDLRHACSCVKCYNNELGQWKESDGEKEVLDVLAGAKKSTDDSIMRLSGTHPTQQLENVHVDSVRDPRHLAFYAQAYPARKMSVIFFDYHFLSVAKIGCRSFAL
jgi:hypothetical protein